mgnify:CR=1 FL=1
MTDPAPVSRQLAFRASVLATFLLSIAFAWPPTLQAAYEADDLYRVELLVFANGSASGSSDESWDFARELTYPDELAFLYPPTRRAQQTVSGDTTLASDPTEPATSLPAAMERLPSRDYSLSGIAKTLKRRPGYRLLYHESWYQYLQDRATAPAIVISGGESYDDHSELEGSVVLSKNRYLHITTHLWFSRFELASNSAFDTTGLSRASSKPSPLDSYDSRPSWSAAQDDAPQDSPTILQQLDSLPPRPLAPPRIAIPAELRASLRSVCRDSDITERERCLQRQLENLGRSVSFLAPKQMSKRDLQTLEAPIRRRYSPSTVVDMQEYRRMRRDDLHYLDHPLFGLIVRIVKYEAEQNDDG